MSRPVEYPNGRITSNVRLPPELNQRLRRVAKERCVGMNLIIERAISEYLDRLTEVET